MSYQADSHFQKSHAVTPNVQEFTTDITGNFTVQYCCYANGMCGLKCLCICLG